MTPNVANPPFAEMMNPVKRAFDRVVQPLLNTRFFAPGTDKSTLNRFDRRALGDIGYDRIDFETDTGAAIQRALVRIHEW